jgi:hypothetical protein
MPALPDLRLAFGPVTLSEDGDGSQLGGEGGGTLGGENGELGGPAGWPKLSSGVRSSLIACSPSRACAGYCRPGI